MANLENKIKEDLKKGMMAKDEFVVSTLRMLVSAIRNKEISVRDEGKAELSDEQVVEVVKSEVKKRNDSIDSYTQGGRNDLAEKELKEIGILNQYLPAEMSDEELEKIVAEVVASSETKDFGKIMGQVMAKVKSGAGGQRVSAAVKKILSA